MGIRNLPLITKKMIDHGRAPETPVALIRWGTRAEQEVLVGTLGDIADKAHKAAFKAPAITVVGEVVNLRNKLRWFDNRPLFGKSIIVTRAADQAGEFTCLLGSHGAQVFECPTIKIIPPATFTELDAAIAELPSFDWLIFTSFNAVNSFFTRLHNLDLDSRAIGNCRICAVGPKTAAALAPYGLKADLVPGNYKAEGVVDAFKKLELKNTRVLFPKADRARELIPAELQKMGATVVAPVAYLNVIPEELPAAALEALVKRQIQCITFTSSSTVENLAAMVGENRLLKLLECVVIASIGPITSKTCRELGLAIDIEPAEYTLAALTADIVRHFSAEIPS